MLYCEIGHASAQAIDDLAVFVSQLNALGLDARIDVRSVPQGLHRNLQFDIAPFLADRAPTAADRVAVVAADRLSDQKLVDLRRIFGRSDAACVALGTFGTRQAEISIRAKLSYVFGEDPEVHDVPATPGLDHHARSGCPVFGVPCPATSHEAPRVLLVGPELEERAQVRALASLATSRHFRVTVLTDAKTKQTWIDAHGMEVPIFQYGECLPASLASRVEICVLFTPNLRYRVQSLLANLAVGGVALIDGTEARAFAGKTDAFISGPIDLTALAPYLQLDILPNLALISQQVRSSALFRQCSAGGVLRTLTGGAPSSAPAARRRDDAPARVVFMPTNGIGLGHAQRCSLIASELDLGRVRPIFAAFPSCVPLIKSHGFDVAPLISRSDQHAQSHENDLANYLRLRALTAGAGALVFDGVYVFDSIFRSVLENRVPGVWIRRGLWQPGQNNASALDREKAFARVIAPSEAFEELNQAYSRGEHLRVVGPIVRPAGLGPEARAALRERLAATFDRGFDRLVVTLLGAGIAVDRSAEIQAICGMMQRRKDVLHLVVVWPGATLQPAWFSWSNSRIVRTNRGAALVAAADLCVSAAGYNSFHEILYTGVPAVFVPQMTSFMDDQRARARAAAERGLAAVVEAGQLMTLEREISRLLDGETEMARRLAALDLPAPGNAQAAALIEEVAIGPSTLDIGAWPDHRAGRG